MSHFYKGLKKAKIFVTLKGSNIKKLLLLFLLIIICNVRNSILSYDIKESQAWLHRNNAYDIAQ